MGSEVNDMEDNRRTTCVDAPVDFGEDTQGAEAGLCADAQPGESLDLLTVASSTLVRTENQLLLSREWVPLGLEKEGGLEKELVKVVAWRSCILGRTATEETDRHAGSPAITPTQG